MNLAWLIFLRYIVCFINVCFILDIPLQEIYIWQRMVLVAMTDSQAPILHSASIVSTFFIAFIAIDFVRIDRKKKGIPMDMEMLECLGKIMKQNVEEEVETGLLMEQVHGAIRKLTIEYQDVLMLKLGNGLKENEIASVLDVKLSTVKTRIYRARKQLRLLFLDQISA